ncbi:hypothetical protein ACFL11_00290 [Patescibacteria group bacterium]
MKISNFQFPISKIQLGLFTLISILAVIPLTSRAFTLDEFFEDFEELFLIESGENSVEIINEINISTNTSDNMINGESMPVVKEGEAKVSIQIENVVNGTEVEPVNIESKANRIEVESKIEVEDDGPINVQRKIEIDSETEIENYKIEPGAEDSIRNETIEQKTIKEKLNFFPEWFGSIYKDLKSFFQNVFNIF